MVKMEQGFYKVKPDNIRAIQIPKFRTDAEGQEIIKFLEEFLEGIPNKLTTYNPTDEIATDKIRIEATFGDKWFYLWPGEWLVLHSNNEYSCVTDETFKKRYQKADTIKEITW